MLGGSTSPQVEIFARAAAQVKKAIEVTHKLGGDGFVFWGGREGYQCVLNTDIAREESHLAKMLLLAHDLKEKIGFKGQLMVEPKPGEPMKHQYDYDAATVLGFLREHGLYDKIQFNIEPNHTQLAGHEFEHDVVYAAQRGNLEASTQTLEAKASAGTLMNLLSTLPTRPCYARLSSKWEGSLSAVSTLTRNVMHRLVICWLSLRTLANLFVFVLFLKLQPAGVNG